MKKWWLALAAALLILGLFLGVRWLKREKPIPVAVAAVERGLVEASVSNTRAGSIKARRRARLSPAIGGRIAAIHVRKGEQAAAGKILLSIWNEDAQAELRLAEHEVKAAEASQREACLLAEQAQRQAKRMAELYENRSTSTTLREESQAAAAAKQASCQSAAARREMSAARVDASRAMLSRSALVAPFAGVIAELHAEVGEYLTPSPPGIATLPAIDLINMDSLYVAAPIDEIDAAQIKPGMDARIRLDAYGDRTFAARVQRIAPYVLEVEKQARTVEVEADFADPNEMKTLLVGYSADMEIVVATQPNTLRIPSEAVLEGNFAYVVDPSSKRLQRRPVDIGIKNWRYTEIRSGLQQDELVVLSLDRQGLGEGALVKLETHSQPGGAKR